MEFDQILHIHLPQPDLGWDCYMSIFADLQRIMAFSYCQNFISPQYLVNELTDFDQILPMHWPYPELHWDCYALILADLKK